MRSLQLGLMSAAILAGTIEATTLSNNRYREETNSKSKNPKTKYKAPPRNDEFHINAAAEKRTRKAAKLREIQERNNRS